MTTTIFPNGKWKNPSDEEIIHFLKSIKRIAIAGLSSNSARPSFGVAQFLQSKGYEIIPVNPKETEVLDQKAYPNLRSVPVPIDLVDCFRRSEVVGETIGEGLALGIKNFWLQEGVWDEARGFLVRQKRGLYRYEPLHRQNLRPVNAVVHRQILLYTLSLTPNCHSERSDLSQGKNMD